MMGFDAPLRRKADPHRLLLRDLLGRLPNAALIASSTEPWASVTFTGARHRIALQLPSASDADAFAVAAREIEFDLRGHLVADLVARSGDAGAIAIEALTVEEA